MSALVLVADPDPFNLRVLHEAWEAAGYAVITAADDQCPEVIWCLVAPLQANAEFHGLALDASGRQLQVLPAQRGLDIGDRELPCGKRQAVQPDAHRRLRATAGLHSGDPGNDSEAVDNVPLHVVMQLHHGKLGAGDIHVHDRPGV